MPSQRMGVLILLSVLWACDSGSFAAHPDQIPTKLAFTLEPTALSEGAATGQVAVSVQDVFGNTVSSAHTSVTVAIGTNPSGAILAGMTTVSAVSGVAVFSGLVFDKSGTGYTLTAAATGLSGTTSAPFDVVPVAKKLAFVVQPSTTSMSGAISPVRLAVQDENGNTMASATAKVTVAIGANPAGGTLSGTTTVAAVDGLAVFSDLNLDRCGTGYTLMASSSGLAGATSAAFDFSPCNPAPTIIPDLIPSCAPVGAQSFTLDVRGINFMSGSVVRWNGSNRPTTFSSGGELFAQIAGNDLASTGAASVTVFNPPPGGGSSNAVTFPVQGGGLGGPASIAVDPTGRFAYVANGGCPDNFPGNVSMYAVDGSTGSLTSIGPPAAAEFGPHAVTVHPSGSFTYVANDGAFEVDFGSVSMYAVDGVTGSLTSTGAISPPFGSDGTPYSIAVHPAGKFAYAALEGGFAPTGVATLSVDAATGALTFVEETKTAGRAVAVTVHPSGRFAYAINGHFYVAADTVSMCTIGAGGALTCTGTVATGADPRAIAIDPLGRSAYVPNAISNDVSMYTIDTATGTWTSAGRVAAGTSPSSIAVDPGGKFAYVANFGSNDVSMYTIGAAGVLASLGTVPAGVSVSSGVSFPPLTSIAVHPSGKFAYVTSSAYRIISIYSIDPSTGALRLTGTTGT